MHWFTTCLVMFAALPAALSDESKNDNPIRVLLATGMDYEGHLWRETTPALRRVLEEDKRMQVRVVEDPDFLASPSLEGYDVIVLHFKNYASLPHETLVRENLANLVKRGKGLVLIHFACGAFEDWPEFADLAGRIWDRKTGHDPRGPFTVRIVASTHPITREMHDFEADDELYTCLVGDRPVEVLALARSKLTGKDHPMAFAFEYGKGRVFHTPLGHDLRAIELPGPAELIRRGSVWASGRPL
jgi:type 1 glutamine amidotransferase